MYDESFILFLTQAIICEILLCRNMTDLTFKEVSINKVKFFNASPKTEFVGGMTKLKGMNSLLKHCICLERSSYI